MAKFYVQSGSLRAVVDSIDADRAALWAIHMAMDQVMPLNDPIEAEVELLSPKRPFVSLGDCIRINEIGFDREDSSTIDTFEAFQHWNQLLHAVNKLQKFLDGE